ncbi:hypothetical protein ACFQ80_06035 [Isoptericola sp. NPDC056578]|uniref:hypothetical protein n=1 Tax=Isoptericola sp. NPDC056578 TaxID=3345870 RepID=UPI00369B3629
MTASPARPTGRSPMLPIVLTAVGCLVVGGVIGAAATYSLTAAADDHPERAPAVTSLDQVPATLQVAASCDGGGAIWDQTTTVAPEAIAVGSDATDTYSQDAYSVARCVAIDTGLTPPGDTSELDNALTEWQDNPGDVTRTWNGWTLTIRSGEDGGSVVEFTAGS